MDVVGHDDEFIVEYLYIGAHLGGAEPFFAGNDAEVVEAHFAVDHLAEEGKALVGDHGDEVTALGGVVIAFEADGAAVVGRRRNGCL